MICYSIVIFFLLVLSYTVGIEDVITPHKADASKYTWIVAIVGKSRQSDLFICTGAVISKKQILTSAWCLEQMPGEVALFAAVTIESYKRAEGVSEKENSLLDFREVIGCFSDKLFHPCYIRVQQCTNAKCSRPSWQYDLAVVETENDMENTATVMDMNLFNFKENQQENCLFIGFDYARMYAEGKDTDQFFLVETSLKVGRGDLSNCTLRGSLKDGVIRSTERFDGFYRFLAVASGYLVCNTQVAGIFMGKIDVESCTVENHHDPHSTRKFWASWTYLSPHKTFIQAAIAGNIKKPTKLASPPLASPPICLTLISLVLTIDFEVVYKALIIL